MPDYHPAFLIFRIISPFIPNNGEETAISSELYGISSPIILISSEVITILSEVIAISSEIKGINSLFDFLIAKT